MATTEASHTSSCPAVGSSAGFHNQTIDNITDLCTSRGLSGWAAAFKDPFEPCLICVQFLLCVTIYVGNCLTLSAMAFDPKLKKTMQNKYIMSLAAADQVTGLNLLHLLMKNYSEGDGAWLSCQPNLALLYTASAVSLMSMLSIAVDRYIYIVHPFVHMRHVTSRRICVLILVQWMLAGLYGSVPIYVFNADQSKGCNPFYLLHRRFLAFSHPTLFFIDCLGIGVTYGLIAKVAREQHNKKSKRVQQINAVIVNCTRNRNKALDSSSTSTEIEQNVVEGDVPRFEHTKQKCVHDADVQTTSARVAMSSNTEEEKVNEAPCDSLAPDGSNQRMENTINNDRNETESLYIIHDILNENINVLTNEAENKCSIPNFDEKEIKSVDTRNEVVVFKTDNTVASTVNKHVAQCVTIESGSNSGNRHSLDKTNTVLSKQEGILTSDTAIKDTECNKGGNRHSLDKTNTVLSKQKGILTSDTAIKDTECNKSGNRHSLDKTNTVLSKQEGILTSDTTIKDTECNKSGNRHSLDKTNTVLSKQEGILTSDTAIKDTECNKSGNRHSLDKTNTILSKQEGILTSDTAIKDTECNNRGKEITASSDDNNNTRLSDSNINTTTQSSNNNTMGRKRLDVGDNTTTEVKMNNNEGKTHLDTSDKSDKEISSSAEGGANIDTGNKTQTVNNDTTQGETYQNNTINTLIVNCDDSRADATLGKSDNKTTKKSNNKSQVRHQAQLPEVEPCQTSQQVSPWSLASLRWMKQMVVVFGLFFLCWTPSMVCILISAVREPDHRVVYVLGMFGVANSAVNVFVYSICNEAYTAAIKKMCCRRFKRN